MINRLFNSLTLAFLLLHVCGGCSDSLQTVPVSGVVLWNGKAVAHAEVTFLRQGGAGPAAIATCDQEGRFQLRTGEHRGVVPGLYKVVVQKSSVVDMQLPEPLPRGMSRSEYLRTNNIAGYPLLPQRYMSATETPLELNVTAEAENHLELKLDGDPPAVPKANAHRGAAA